MTKIWFLMRDGSSIDRRVFEMGGTVPARGDIYTFHRKDSETGRWIVSGIYRDLHEGAAPGALDMRPPFSRVDPDEAHQGDEVVVVLDPVSTSQEDQVVR